MEVGVRELRRKLSEYLDKANAGEVIYVTDRGKLKATLGPVPAEAAIERGIREGWITPGNGTPPVESRRRYPAPISTEELINEDRGE